MDCISIGWNLIDWEFIGLLLCKWASYYQQELKGVLTQQYFSSTNLNLESFDIERFFLLFYLFKPSKSPNVYDFNVFILISHYLSFKFLIYSILSLNPYDFESEMDNLSCNIVHHSISIVWNRLIQIIVLWYYKHNHYEENYSSL